MRLTAAAAVEEEDAVEVAEVDVEEAGVEAAVVVVVAAVVARRTGAMVPRSSVDRYAIVEILLAIDNPGLDT